MKSKLAVSVTMLATAVFLHLIDASVRQTIIIVSLVVLCILAAWFINVTDGSKRK